MNEKELDMNELINDFNEYSTDYIKTTCEYYRDYLKKYQKEKLELQQRIDKAIGYIETTSFYMKSHYDYRNELLEILKGEPNDN